MKSALIVTGVLLLVVGIVAYEVSLWNECRTTNSFFYCMGILSK